MNAPDPWYDTNHPALRLGWWFVQPCSEVATYKGYRLRIEHRGHDERGYPTVNCGYIDGRHQFNDPSFQRLVIRLVEKVDRLGN